MPRFAANLSMLYTDLPFLDRFGAAAKDGFRAVEWQFGYAWSPAEIARRIADHGLEPVALNVPASSRAAGIADRGAAGSTERGFGAVAGRETDFREGLSLALEYARAIDVPNIHVMAGIAPREAASRRTFVDNLRWASEQVSADDVTLLIEAINQRDMPGYFLSYQADAHAIVEEVASPKAKVMMDLYHCQVMEGGLAAKLAQYLPTGRVGHLQFAGAPERHEPDVGEVFFPYLFDRIDALGWTGWVGAEYKPRDAGPGGTSRGLAWMHRGS